MKKQISFIMLIFLLYGVIDALASGKYDFPVTSILQDQQTGSFVLSDTIQKNINTESNLIVSPSSLSVTMPGDSLVVKKITLFNSSATGIDFEIKVLETSKRILFESGKQESKGDSPDDYLNFLNYQFENGPVEAKNFSWLTINANAVNVQAQQSLELDLIFDTNDLPGDVYNAAVLISYNNSNEPDKIIHITLNSSRADCPYLITIDNENNAGQGIPDWDLDDLVTNDETKAQPVEFNFFIEEVIITSAELSIYALDVDETGSSPNWGFPEVDEVYLNGHYLGNLSGASDVWSTTIFTVDPAHLILGPNGKNIVEIWIDVLSATVGEAYWGATIDWGQLKINDCEGGNAYLRYIEIDKTVYYPGDDITISSETDTDLASMDILVETNLLDENLFNVDGLTTPLTISGTQDERLDILFSIPVDATLNVDYKAQVIVYDENFVIQDNAEITFPIGNVGFEVSPDSLIVSMCEDDLLTQSLTLSNTGDVDIDFIVSTLNPWLSMSPSLGIIPPGNSANVQVNFNTAGIAFGEYTGEIQINTNFPAIIPSITIPVSMEVLQRMVIYSTASTGDNENNLLTGEPDNDLNVYLCKADPKLPVEFNFFIDHQSIQVAELKIEAFDVDENAGNGLPFGEMNEVFFNGTQIGELTGVDEGVSFTSLNVPPAIINPGPNGKNLVQIYVSVLGKYWCTNIQSAELIIGNCN